MFERLIIPKRLKVGDTIGVVSPSMALDERRQKALETASKIFEDMGFKIKLAPHVFAKDDYSAGTPKQRASDINAFFTDKDIHMVFCSVGGDTANGVLPFLDFKTIKRNPKIFMGYSDITVLLNAIKHKTGLQTYHGGCLTHFGAEDLSMYDIAEFKHILMEGRKGLIPASDNKRAVVRDGIATGRLIGGNIKCLLKLAGTSYFPNFKDGILFLESYRTTPGTVDFMCEHLKQLGVFDQIKGAVVGYIYGLEKPEIQRPTFEDILKKVSKEYSFPILKCNDFGHKCPNTVLPLGAPVRLDTERLTLELL